MKGYNVNEEAPQVNQDPQANQALIYLSTMSDVEFRATTGDGNFSNDKSDGQGRPKFKQRYYGQDPSNTPWFNQEKGSGSPLPKPTCTKCEKKHHGKCLVDTDGCYGCGKSDHKVKHFPTLTAKRRETKQDSLKDLVPIPPNYGHFYAFRSREDKGVSPYEGTGLFIVPYRCKCFIKIPMLFVRF
uniref:Gag-pol polyprotein n=1 Tax=Solanum tuberosum TaxID=4113 RepID=M1DCP0_SOLTU